MDFSPLLIKMTIFMILLIIGYMGARKGTLNPEFSKAASALLLNVFIVASIVNSVIGERPALSKEEFWKAFGLLWLMTAVMYVLSALCVLPFGKRREAPQMELMMSVVNNLFIGMPIAQSIFGNEAVFYMGISCVPYNLFLYSYGVWRLQKQKTGGGFSWKNLLSAPMIAAVVSLVVFLVNPPIPRLVKELFSSVSAATSPLSMIIIGATLGRVSLSAAFKDRNAYYISFVRLLLVPAVVFFLLRGMTDNMCVLMTCVIIAGCPSGAITTPISIRYGYDPEYSSKTVMVSTLLSMITLPVLVKILR